MLNTNITHLFSYNYMNSFKQIKRLVKFRLLNNTITLRDIFMPKEHSYYRMSK